MRNKKEGYMRKFFAGWSIIAAAMTLAWSTSAWSQDWPKKPITLIVPFAAGGSVDAAAREVAQALGARLGQPVVVDNRGGAAGLIGTDYVAKSAPDGYTIVMGSAGTIAIAPHIYGKMPFNPLKDLIAITPVAQGINVMVVPTSSSAKSVKDFIARAKAAPNKVNFGSSGLGSSDHMATELFSNMAGIKMTNIPYKGGAPAMVDLVGGNVDVMFSAVAPAIAQIKAGRLRALGVTSANRLEALPDVPTIAEAGVKGYESVAWYGLFAPAKTPPEVIKKLNREAVAAMRDENLRKRLTDAGLLPVSSTPEAFASYVVKETEKWGKLVKANGIKVE
jgi:tripartite-type tricarboxylate transporter receptor subunit TctC